MFFIGIFEITFLQRATNVSFASSPQKSRRANDRDVQEQKTHTGSRIRYFTGCLVNLNRLVSYPEGVLGASSAGVWPALGFELVRLDFRFAPYAPGQKWWFLTS